MYGTTLIQASSRPSLVTILQQLILKWGPMRIHADFLKTCTTSPIPVRTDAVTVGVT